MITKSLSILFISFFIILFNVHSAFSGPKADAYWEESAANSIITTYHEDPFDGTEIRCAFIEPIKVENGFKNENIQFYASVTYNNGKVVKDAGLRVKYDFLKNKINVGDKVLVDYKALGIDGISSEKWIVTMCQYDSEYCEIKSDNKEMIDEFFFSGYDIVKALDLTVKVHLKDEIIIIRKYDLSGLHSALVDFETSLNEKYKKNLIIYKNL